jgi:glycosyltransferase involved in cell wall biosynthesis
MNTVEDKKINILYLVSRLRRQGPIFQLYNLIKYLDRKKFYPRIITLSPDPPESLMAAFKKDNVECDSLGLSRMAGMILGPKRIMKLLYDNPADLIHVSDYRSVLLCANHLVGFPRVVSCRQVFHHTHYTLSGDIGPILSRVMVKTFSRACEKCECVVAVSNFVRDSAGEKLATRTRVIHNGVDQDKFKPVSEEEKASLRSRFGLPQNKRIFLTIGFLSRRKDPLTIINAFLKSGVSRTGVLVFLGDGPLKQQCCRLSDLYSNIHVIGFVENVRDYLHASDVFVSASLTEGCPNAIMEALACGLPVVLSDIPAHREILAFNERAGLLFPTEDTASLSEMLSKTDGMHYPEQSQAAVSIINNHLNARNMSLRYQELYTQLYNRVSRQSKNGKRQSK